MATPDLLAAVRQGDAAATESLIRRCEATVRRLVRMRGGNAKVRRVVDSVDICQSVLADLLKAADEGRLPALSEDGAVRYVATMALHKLIDRARHEGPNQGSIPEGWDPATATPSPSQVAGRNELVAKCRGLMSDLEWNVVLLRQSGHKWEEIGREVGKDADAARMVYRRALARARKSERGGQ